MVASARACVKGKVENGKLKVVSEERAKKRQVRSLKTKIERVAVWRPSRFVLQNTHNECVR